MNMVQYLLERGVDITSSNNNGRTALHLCVLNAPEDLLIFCWNMCKRDTALHFATRSCTDDMTRLLLKNGADANQRNPDRSTMLHHCVLHGNICIDSSEGKH